jgi:hypothetical protein
MTAATLRQMAAPEAIVKSEIHILGDSLFAFLSDQGSLNLRLTRSVGVGSKFFLKKAGN